MSRRNDAVIMKYALLALTFALTPGAQSQSLNVSPQFVQGAGSFADPED
jgi:hypothetical protein